MNRRVVILSFIYDSFANFSARWYMISSMVGVSFSHGKSVQKRCICGSGLFKAIETAHPISCWTSSFVIPSFSAMISKYLSTEYVFLSFIVSRLNTIKVKQIIRSILHNNLESCFLCRLWLFSILSYTYSMVHTRTISL